MTKKTHPLAPIFIFKFRQLATDTRKLKQITQGELAKRIGSTQSAIANFEAGNNMNPKIEFVCSIADALGIGLDLRLPFRKSPSIKINLPEPSVDLD